MKRRPSGPGALLGKIKGSVSPLELKRSVDRLIDDVLVRAGWMPRTLNGSGKVLHMSDTPTAIYGYLARLLRRVNPSVVIHTGDLADDIKLELYAGEEGHYRAAMLRLAGILQSPHRRVYIVLGNHDRLDLLPDLPPQFTVCDGTLDITVCGERFRISHRVASLREVAGNAGWPGMAKYNLFGHEWVTGSYVDEDGRYFFNGVETMRLIDPATDEIEFLRYPQKTDRARMMRHGGRSARRT